MANRFLFDLALAVQQHEGYFPGSNSFRLRNPGNIRSADGSFMQYPTYALGFAALEGDLSAKMENRSQAMNRYYAAHGITYEQAKFFDFQQVYSPLEDHNDPTAYCDALCRALSQYNLKPYTPLSQMAQLIMGIIDRIPDDVSPIIDPEARIRGLERRIQQEQDPSVRDTITRLLKRLLARIGRTS